MGDIRDDGAIVTCPLFQNDDAVVHPTSPRQLNICEISVERAIELNQIWHSRLPKITNPYGDHIYFGAEFNGRLYACAIWTRPVARLFNNRGILELRRMAICKEAPKYTASRMLSVMIKIIKKKKPHIVKLISYQDTDVHSGTIYKASGWTVAIKTQGGSNTATRKQTWKSNVRTRDESQSTAYKIRWEKDI